MLGLVNCRLSCNVALKQYLIWNLFSYINLYDRVLCFNIVLIRRSWKDLLKVFLISFVLLLEFQRNYSFEISIIALQIIRKYYFVSEQIVC